MSQMVNIMYDKTSTLNKLKRGSYKMKRIDLTMTEQEKYEIIKSLVDHHGNKRRASVQLGCSLRHVNRLIARYKKEGKEAFSHGNKGRKPVHTFSDALKSEIITLYNNKYSDATFAYACELLEKHDRITISAATLSKILYQEHIASPRTTKKTKKKMAAQLKELQKKSLNKKEREHLQTSIVALEDAHPRRSRCANFGEMIQMDASVHHWFGEEKAHLHIAIDDSTGSIIGAYFDKQETLNGYYNVFYQILNTYGIPAMFYTDKRTVFEYKRSNNKKIENDTFTQFSYACHQLGVELKTTSVAQAKGRVERAFQTLQQRLPIALRLAGIYSLSEANVFLNSYIKEHNAKFALPIDHTKSVFINQPKLSTIHQILSVITERSVDCGHCIKFQNQYYRTIDSHGIQVHYHAGTKGLVIKTFDKQLLFSVNDKIYELEPVPSYERFSRNFDFETPKEKPKKRNIPSSRHPWRNSTFLKFKDHSIPVENPSSQNYELYL